MTCGSLYHPRPRHLPLSKKRHENRCSGNSFKQVRVSRVSTHVLSHTLKELPFELQFYGWRWSTHTPSRGAMSHLQKQVVLLESPLPLPQPHLLSPLPTQIKPSVHSKTVLSLMAFWAVPFLVFLMQSLITCSPETWLGSLHQTQVSRGEGLWNSQL